MACACLLIARPGSASDQPTLATVLQRAAAYVADFHLQLAGVVAEERYVQEVKAFPKRAGQLANPMRSELHCLLLVRPATAAAGPSSGTSSRSTASRSGIGPTG